MMGYQNKKKMSGQLNQNDIWRNLDYPSYVIAMSLL